MRPLLILVLAFGVSLAPAARAQAPDGAGENVTVSHAIAMHGAPKYGPDFTHFEYLNPDAPKGGFVKLGAEGTFDSFNPFIPKGDSAGGLGYLFETLLTSSADEAFTEYCLICETVEWPKDRSWVAFTLRPDARWHDGEPITVEDVIWSLETLKSKGAPFFRFYYQSVVKAEKVGARKVRFTFAEGDNRELPLIIGQMAVLPKHYWESEGRDFESTTLEPPLGSGPYRIAEFEPGRFVVYERLDDYWGQDLAINRGQYNFDRIRFDYYRDATIIRQALKAGNIDYREENTAKAWAQEYDVPVVRQGWLRKERFEHDNPTGMQSFAMNIRREVFQDRRVRRALAYAFDFEWTNRNLFYGQYTRTESFFSNSELASSGLPSEDELEILEPYRGRIPEEVFTKAYFAPSTDGSGWPRDNLRRAFELLAEAGWVVRDMKLVDAETGRQMSFEILLVSQAFERIALPFKRNLERLGIEVRVRTVDSAQYINRLRSFDFDMIVASWGQSASPGNEQRDFWGSDAADSPGSRNYVGIEDPAIDDLIDLIISAPDRESLITRTRALDRVLLWNHFVIPQWHIEYDRILYWNKFGFPEEPPRQGTSINYWWIDPAKVQALASRTPQAAETAGGGDETALGRIALYAGIAALLLFGFLSLRRLNRRSAH